MVDSDKMMVFNLGFWDIGDSTLKKYAYIQPVSKKIIKNSFLKY